MQLSLLVLSGIASRADKAWRSAGEVGRLKAFPPFEPRSHKTHVSPTMYSLQFLCVIARLRVADGHINGAPPAIDPSGASLA